MAYQHGATINLRCFPKLFDVPNTNIKSTDSFPQRGRVRYNTWKLPKIIEVAKAFPESPVIVIGGLGRLASAGAREAGAEAYEMHKLLLREELAPQRITAIGCRECQNDSSCSCVGTTGFNIDRLLDHMRGNLSLLHRPLLIIEESFLARRVFATLLGRLRENGGRFFEGVTMLPTSTPLEALENAHGFV